MSDELKKARDNWHKATENLAKSMFNKVDELKFNEDFLEFFADIESQIKKLKASQNDIVFGIWRDKYTHEERIKKKQEIEIIINKFSQCGKHAYKRAKSLGINSVIFC